MKVAVYTIALDEARFVERYLDSCAAADVIVVADTGSTDGTAELLAAGGAIVPRISVEPWRFDDARNASLAMVPADVDVCVVVDLDEVLSDGWRDALEAEWGDATRGRYEYVFNRDASGRPDLTYWHDRIHSRHGYRWVYACHEHLVADRIDERYTTLSLRFDQFADTTKPRGHYLGLLEVNADEHPDLPRAAHYLGREYYYVGRWADALVELERHLALPTSTWHPERAASWRLISRCQARLGRPEEAHASARSAATEAPELREGWVELAQVSFDQQRWDECAEASARALAITERSTDYFNEGWAWGARAEDLASVSAWWQGRHVDALTHARRAAAIDPHDERLARNVTFIEQAVVASAVDAALADGPA